jgi:hypothetical protein
MVRDLSTASKSKPKTCRTYPVASTGCFWCSLPFVGGTLHPWHSRLVVLIPPGKEVSVSNHTRRTLSVLCLSLVMCLPLQAQTRAGRMDTLSGFFSLLWARVSAPLVSLWATETTDGRGAVDPDGLTTNSDGRGACDPDGVTACGS